jgi:hypothetical protein
MTSGGQDAAAVTPHGTSYVSLRGSKEYIQRYISGGPGCDVCRDKVAQSANVEAASERQQLIDRFVTEQKAAQAVELLKILRTEPASAEEKAVVLSAVASAVPKHRTAELLHLQLSPHARLSSKVFPHQRPLVTIREVVAGLRWGDSLFSAQGDLFSQYGQTVSTQGGEAWVAVSPGARTIPPIKYRPAEGGWGSSNPAHWDVEGALRREGFDDSHWARVKRQ